MNRACTGTAGERAQSRDHAAEHLEIPQGPVALQFKHDATHIGGAGQLRDIGYPMIVNDALVSLPAWQVKGIFMQADTAVPVEWFILYDAKNALTLRFAFGKDKLEIVRIAYPAADETKKLESELSAERRTVLYGVYFDFNSATIKSSSNPVLNTIVAVIKKNPQWHLGVEGHTDNIGGDTQNKISRHGAPRPCARRSSNAGLPKIASRPPVMAPPRRATNATLAGRAHNRRVELTRL